MTFDRQGRGRTVAAIAAVVGLVVAIAFVARTLPGRRSPNVLLVTIDTLRASRVGCYGHPNAATPTLDRLAAGGARFERCYAPAPVTRPSHATILTGREPYHHGVRDNLSMALRPEETTLAEVLAAAGYRTAAVVAAQPLASASGLAQGFEVYDEALGPGSIDHFPERRADAVTDAALASLAGLEEGDGWFLWVHYFDPHAEYDPPAELLEGAGDRYDGEVAFVDRELGRLLEAVDLDGTLVVVTADHGEGLGAHGEPTHAYFLYDTTIQVPLILHWPDRIPPGTEVEGMARLVDVGPTILDLAGIDEGPAVDGVSLVEALGGGSTGVRTAYAESFEGLAQYGWRPLRSLRDEEYKLIDWGEGRRELYRTVEDRPERRDLLAGPGAGDERTTEVALRLSRELADLARLRPTADPVAVDLRGRLHLGSIPYGSLAGETTGNRPPADPAAFLQDVNRILRLAADGRHRQALAVIERLRADDEDNPFLLLLAGKMLEAEGDLERARRAYDRLLERRPADPLPWRLTITIRLSLGLFEEVVLRCRASEEESAFRHGSLGYALLRLDRPAEAVVELERAVALDPDSSFYADSLEEARNR